MVLYEQTSTIAPKIISQEDWKAIAPNELEFGIKFPCHTVHRSFAETDRCATRLDCIRVVRQLQKDHLAAQLPDIKHSFYIGDDGLCYAGRGWLINSWLPDELKPDKDKVITIGYFGRKGEVVSEVQEKITEELIARGVWSEFLIKEPKVVDDL